MFGRNKKKLDLTEVETDVLVCAIYTQLDALKKDKGQESKDDIRVLKRLLKRLARK
jgi:hypothetical protein